MAYFNKKKPIYAANICKIDKYVKNFVKVLIFCKI